ncbi:MAG TPA: NAD-dependent epimerase/dehydratase family protein [Streptosporangiaceae bacterium]|jgi:UDP-glucose 4-epimerase
MRVAVTGGCGFIGSHVVDHLVRAGHEVRVIDLSAGWRQSAADYLDADLFDEAALGRALAGCEAVFHLAGAADVNEVAANPVAAVRLNVEGTARVLDAARGQGCGRVLLASTVWVYGATVGEGELTEDAAVDLRRAGHVYVSTKLAAEMLVHSYREMYGQHFTILRYGIPYGPRMRDVLVVAKFVQAALQGRPLTIAGSGEQQRNYVYVEDLADAHVRALSPAAQDRTLALEGGVPVSVREIADTVRDLVRNVTIEHVPARTADYQGVSVSGGLAKELLDWAPVTPFAEGVHRYLEWLASTRVGTGAADAGGQPRP